MLTLISVIFCFAIGATGFHYFSAANKLKAQLEKQAMMFAAQSKELMHSKTSCLALEQVQLNRRKEQLDATNSLAEAINQASSLQKMLDEKQTYFSKKIGDVEAQRDHILKLFETIDDERSLAVSELLNKNTEHQQTEGATQSLLSNLKNENRNLRNQLNEQELELTHLRARPTIKAYTVESLRRRSTHNETLFHSMRGLREMSDERSQNWEVALKKMATWILTSSPLALPNDPVLSQSIGPVVGEALSRIGSSLVEFSAEDELAAERQALRATEH
jgi:hypothetical protein